MACDVHLAIAIPTTRFSANRVRLIRMANIRGLFLAPEDVHATLQRTQLAEGEEKWIIHAKYKKKQREMAAVRRRKDAKLVAVRDASAGSPVDLATTAARGKAKAVGRWVSRRELGRGHPHHEDE